VPDQSNRTVLLVERVAMRFLADARVHVLKSAEGESALLEMRRRSRDVAALVLRAASGARAADGLEPATQSLEPA
jgi:hypothetical protein